MKRWRSILKMNLSVYARPIRENLHVEGRGIAYSHDFEQTLLKISFFMEMMFSMAVREDPENLPKWAAVTSTIPWDRYRKIIALYLLRGGGPFLIAIGVQSRTEDV
jgi:hypothetical protein